MEANTILGFGVDGSLTLMCNLICGFCSVRQTRGLHVVSLFLHPASFRFHLAMNKHPCLRPYPSRYRADSVLSPFRNVRCRAYLKVGRTVFSVRPGMMSIQTCLTKTHNTFCSFLSYSTLLSSINKIFFEILYERIKPPLFRSY